MGNNNKDDHEDEDDGDEDDSEDDGQVAEGLHPPQAQPPVQELPEDWRLPQPPGPAPSQVGPQGEQTNYTVFRDNFMDVFICSKLCSSLLLVNPILLFHILGHMSLPSTDPQQTQTNSFHSALKA